MMEDSILRLSMEDSILTVTDGGFYTETVNNGGFYTDCQ